MTKKMMTRWRTALLLIVMGPGLALAAGCAAESPTDGPPVLATQEVDVPALPAPDLYVGSPYLGELRNSLVYGEIWERPQLSKRDRSLITIAVLQALVRDELAIHIPRGLDNGLSPEEISEIILHVTFYAGWPTGVQASLTAAEVFEHRGLSLGELPRAPSGADASTPDALNDAYRSVPRLGALRNSLLYGDIWERPLLSKRDRSLITVAVNQALYATSELRTHIDRALDDNGVTPQEISEVILHVTFYAGWPAAVNAGRLATAAFEARGVDMSQLQ
ncbi:MAG: carboxymuconolactone decarboxylase family protein [Acidobacteria bacterium]|nr:carboxymuconolactone decarboxylase family protein [Acidobacteriota bacterium]